MLIHSVRVSALPHQSQYEMGNTVVCGLAQEGIPVLGLLHRVGPWGEGGMNDGEEEGRKEGGDVMVADGRRWVMMVEGEDGGR
jgi:hypothetical protein